MSFFARATRCKYFVHITCDVRNGLLVSASDKVLNSERKRIVGRKKSPHIGSMKAHSLFVAVAVAQSKASVIDDFGVNTFPELKC